VNRLISIIVPCYNEQEALTIFYKELIETLGKMDYGYELILINDGSDDETLEVIHRLAEQDNNIIFISFARNFGKEAAMYAGFCNTAGSYYNTQAYIWRPGCRMGFYNMYYNFYWRNAAFLPWCYWAVYRQNIYGNKAPPTLYYI